MSYYVELLPTDECNLYKKIGPFYICIHANADLISTEQKLFEMDVPIQWDKVPPPSIAPFLLALLFGILLGMVMAFQLVESIYLLTPLSEIY